MGRMGTDSRTLQSQSTAGRKWEWKCEIAMETHFPRIGVAPPVESSGRPPAGTTARSTGSWSFLGGRAGPKQRDRSSLGSSLSEYLEAQTKVWVTAGMHTAS